MQRGMPAAATMPAAEGEHHHFTEYSNPWPMATIPLIYIGVCAALSPGAPVDWSLPHAALHGLSAAGVIGRGRFTYEYYYQVRSHSS